MTTSYAIEFHTRASGAEILTVTRISGDTFRELVRMDVHGSHEIAVALAVLKVRGMRARGELS